MNNISELLHKLADEFYISSVEEETKFSILQDKIDKQTKDIEIIKEGLRFILKSLENNK